MRKPWHATLASKPPPEASKPPQTNTTPQSIRGRISDPIPILGPLDQEITTTKYSTMIGSAIEGDVRHTADGDGSMLETGATAPNQGNGSTASAQVARRQSRVAQLVQDVKSRGTDAGSSLPRYAGHQRDQSNPYRASVASVADPSENGNKPRRKKSTLRGAFEKLFGSKKTMGLNASTGEGPNTRPTLEHLTPQRHDTSPLPKVEHESIKSRGASSVASAERGKALGSHSITPEDRLVINSARNSTQPKEDFLKTHRATQSFGNQITFSTEPTGLTPRPASVTGRVSGYDGQDENSVKIGRLVTPRDASLLKRRSRSLSALANLSNVFSPGGSSPQNLDQASDASSHYSTRKRNNEEETKKNGNADLISDWRAVPSALNSGPNGVKSMKITEAADVNDRVSHLADRVDKLNKAIENLTKLVHDSLSVPRSPIQRRPTPHPQGRPASTWSSDSEMSEMFENPQTAGEARTLSTSTIRGTTSLPSLHHDGSKPFTADHYHTLMALLQNERTERKHLQARFNAYADQLEVLLQVVLGKKGRSHSPPISKFEEDDDDNCEGYAPNKHEWAGTEGGESSHDQPHLRRVSQKITSGNHEDDETKRKGKSSVSSRGIGNGKGKSKGKEMIHDGKAGEPYKPLAYERILMAERDKEAAARQKAERTLSLSQMTMKEPQP